VGVSASRAVPHIEIGGRKSSCKKDRVERKRPRGPAGSIKTEKNGNFMLRITVHHQDRSIPPEAKKDDYFSAWNPE